MIEPPRERNSISHHVASFGLEQGVIPETLNDTGLDPNKQRASAAGQLQRMRFVCRQVADDPRCAFFYSAANSFSVSARQSKSQMCFRMRMELSGKASGEERVASRDGREVAMVQYFIHHSAGGVARWHIWSYFCSLKRANNYRLSEREWKNMRATSV